MSAPPTLLDQAPEYTTKPGHKIMCNGEVYYAVAQLDKSCNGCAFERFERADSCPQESCRNIIWLTPFDYIKHRLTK